MRLNNHTTMSDHTPDQCQHGRTKTIKRARESHEMEPWEDKIIEQCRECGEYIIT